jgi:hypothetical protein
LFDAPACTDRVPVPEEDLTREIIGAFHDVYNALGRGFLENIAARIIVEVKATPVLIESNKRQLLNYLTAMNVEVGLLLHYGPNQIFFACSADGGTIGNGAISQIRVIRDPCLLGSGLHSASSVSSIVWQ